MLETKRRPLAVALTRMAWISLRMPHSWRGPVIECVWLSLAGPLSSEIDELTVGVGAMSSDLGGERHCGDHAVRGFHVALKHSSYSVDVLN